MSTEGRPAAIAARFARLSQQLFAFELQPFKSDGEKRAIRTLIRAAADVSSFIMTNKSDGDRMANVERERIRAIAVSARAYALRNHLTLCIPFWASQSPRQANTFSAFGSDDWQALLAELAAPYNLEPIDLGNIGSPDQIRWDEINSSNFAVFDFRRVSRDEGLWPSIAHALGLAVSVGTLPVIITDGQIAPPFNIDFASEIVRSDRPIESQLSKILADAAVAQFQLDNKGESVRATIEEILRNADDGDHRVRYLRPHLEAVLKSNDLDPEEARLYAKSMLDVTGVSGQFLFTPVWPGRYPVKDSTRVFHVLPFALIEETAGAVEFAVPDRSMYVRGNTTGDIDVMDGMWNAICEATHVIVDLTPEAVDGSASQRAPNANVCFELAMAQALGRSILCVRHKRAKEVPVFTEIAKLQILPYASTDELAEIVGAFLNK